MQLTDSASWKYSRQLLQVLVKSPVKNAGRVFRINDIKLHHRKVL
jgi:hypothetical protein